MPNSWIKAHQTLLPTGFLTEGYWSGWPFPSPGNLPDPGIKASSPALQADSLPLRDLGSPAKVCPGFIARWVLRLPHFLLTILTGMCNFWAASHWAPWVQILLQRLPAHLHVQPHSDVLGARLGLQHMNFGRDAVQPIIFTNEKQKELCETFISPK